MCLLLSVVEDAVLASGYNIASILLTRTFDVWVLDCGDSFYNTNHVNNTCVHACVLFYLLHAEHRRPHSTCKVRIFLENQEILAGLPSVKGLFDS